MNTRSAEELKLGFDRMEAAQECRNLMGKYSYLHTAMRNQDFVQLWADREDDILAMPWGYYLGKKGVEDCYLKDHGDRSDPAVQHSPIFKGGMMMHAMDTCVIEVAGDGRTARGAWLSPGHESCYIPDFDKIPGWKKGDPVPPDAPMVSSCEWAWSKYSIDFIRDADGKWKFWKLRLWPIYKTDFYVPWTEHPDMEEGDFPFKYCKRYHSHPWAWSPDSVYPPDQPEPPLPYEHYEDANTALWDEYV